MTAHPALRRLTAPVWLLLAAAGAIASPLLLLLGAIAARVLGRPQPLLIVRFGLRYLLREAAVILAAAGLWLLSGFGRRLGERRFRRAHYRLMLWLVAGLVEPAFEALELQLDTDASAAAQRALEASDRPLLVLSRHAGPGDSVVILRLLLERYRREPRIVLKQQLALDPVVDLLARRLPNVLVDPDDQDACEARIRELARDLDGRGVLLLFPEGGNFTPERRRRAIDRLRRGGRRREARRAQEMRHVIAPKPGGALAALRANPDLDVVFTAHTGFGLETFASQLWRRVPTNQTLKLRLWLAPAADRPAAEDAQVQWLYDWWKRLDDWIETQGDE